MTSTTETATADQSANNQTTGTTQEPVSPVSDNGAQTDGATNTETASPKKAAPPKPTVHKVDFEKDVVYLYQLCRCAALPSTSPFCLKVENWLRMNGIQYENVEHNTLKSKKGQLPFIELNGKEIPDSDIIIRELSKHFDKDLDEGLTAEQKTISHAFESMLNNNTSWVVRWWRYNNPQKFIDLTKLDVKRAFNYKALPGPLVNFVFKLGFKQNVKQTVGHGIGHHSEEEIYGMGRDDLKALSDYLADKEYFFGKEPHLLDCVAFAHVSQFVYTAFGGFKEWMETETPNLLAHVDRMKVKYWSDWDQITETLEMNTHLPKKELTPEEEEKIKKEEQKKEEDKKKKEEKKKQLEEKKKEREEKKKKEKEEKERKKKEDEEKKRLEKEKREAEKKEKEEKEKAEKEAKEKADKEKAEADKIAAETKAAEEKAATESTTETKETDGAAKEAAAAPATEESGDKKE